MLNIVIPMAGAGSRFASEGYGEPKPLIPVHGRPMIQTVINNLRPACDHRFIFVCRQAHIDAFALREKLDAWAPGCEIASVPALTEGAACTVLAARSFINTEFPLMIANSDQYVDVSIDDYLNVMARQKYDGLIMTMRASDPKWSFVALDANQLVTQVAEKQVISNEATVGIYNFKRGADFVEQAEAMIATNERVNGEFYVAPVYNRLIAAAKQIGIFNIGSEGAGMYGLGIPSDLQRFLASEVSLNMRGQAV
ncbi:MAG: glycosyltransferase family 2 protein [Rhodoferax sp.]|nr:glycosyltransferase family 2 protein [Rhodoferax sp.]